MRQPLDYDFMLKGLIGTLSPVVGVLTSLQEQVEWGLRVSSLMVGLLVGITSLVSMIRKMRKP
jgi:flagellar motor component MotA